MSRLLTFVAGAAAGAAAAHFLDPDSGSRRREQARSTATSAAGKAKDVSGKAKGVADKAKGAAPTSGGGTDLDDVSLARKVETEIFRDADAPKGSVSVDVQDGVAHLRGEVEDEQWIARLADDAKKVDGIKGVENLLHKPGTPTPGGTS